VATSAIVATNQTIHAAGTVLDKQNYGQKVLVNTDYVEAAGEDVGSSYTFLGFPKGSIPVMVLVLFDALGTSSTLKGGTAADDDRFFAAAATNAAGYILSNLLTQIGTAVTADTPIVLTSAGAAVTGTIRVFAFYIPVG